MKKLLMNAVGAIAVSGALLAAVPAEARSGWGHGGYKGHRHGGSWNNHSNWSGRGHHDRGRYGYYGRGYKHRGYHGYRSYYPAYGYGYGGYWGPRYYGYGYRYHDDDAALALGVGLLGVAVGTAIASDRYHDDRYYDRRGDGYYDYNYDYGYGY